jgi:DNA-binding transcriptional LysR family regulator
MDFRHLRAFIAVAEESSVTKAAERLHISQPPLTRHIRQLEGELGVTLFVRHRQGVTLTEAGHTLLEKARTLAAAAAEFYETAGRSKEDDLRKVRVGIGWGLWDPVNRIRVEYARRAANATIEATDVVCQAQCDEQMRARSLDVVFGRPPFDGSYLEVVPLVQEPIQAVLSEDHPLASRESLQLRELADEPLLLWDRHVMPVLYDKILDLYAAAGVTPKMIPTPDAGPYNHAGLMLVASGKGTYLCLGIPLTSCHPATGIAVVPLSDRNATIDVCVAWRKGETSPMVHQFLNSVWQVFPQAREASPAAMAPSRRAS